MSATIQKGLRSGATFSVVIIFFALIGFTVTLSTLIGKILANAPKGNEMPPVLNLGILVALLAIWAGANASKPNPVSDRLSDSIMAGISAGAFCGLWIAGYALIMGTVNDNKIDLRTYLSAVSPDSIRFFLFNQTTQISVVMHFAIQTVFGLGGALMAYGLRHSNWRQWIGQKTLAIRENYRRFSETLQAHPYFIYIIYALVAILLFFFPRVWGSYWNYVIGTVGIYIIMGLGLNIIVGLAGQLVLGYVAFFAIGAYAAALLTAPQPHHLMWDFWPVLLIGTLLAALTGIILGFPILRLRGDYLAIVTLGFGEIIRIMLRSDVMIPITAGPQGVRAIGGPAIFGYPLTSDINFMYLIIVMVLITIFITDRLQNSRTGRAWVAIREDEIAARATGISTFKSKLLALAIGAAFAGVGGVLFASRNQFTGPEDHTLMVSINVLALVIVGGMGSIPGIILGAFALKGLPEILRELENYRLLVFGALLVVMMIIRPEGLWPASRPNLENLDKKNEPPPNISGSANQEGVEHASKS